MHIKRLVNQYFKGARHNMPQGNTRSERKCGVEEM